MLHLNHDAFNQHFLAVQIPLFLTHLSQLPLRKINLVCESFLPTHLKLVLLPDGIQNFPFVSLNFLLNFHRNFRHLNTDILNILLKQYPVHFVLQCVPLCRQSAPLLEQFIGNFFVALCSH